MSFNSLDIIFVALITLFTVRCYVKGFAAEFLSMAAIVLAILAAVFFYKNGSVFVRERYLPGAGILADVVAFAGIFLIVFISVKIIEMMVKNIINKIEVSSGDRALGIVFGLAEGFALMCFILFLLKTQPLFDATELLSESFFSRLMLPLIAGREKLPDV